VVATGQSINLGYRNSVA